MKVPFKLVKIDEQFRYGNCLFKKIYVSRGCYASPVGKPIDYDYCSSFIQQGYVTFAEDTLVEIEPRDVKI